MIEEQYNRAITILKKHKQKLNTLANLLLEKEVIFKDDLLKILEKAIRLLKRRRIYQQRSNRRK